MSERTLKDIIKQEYIKCATDPVYFMKKYCYIQHPLRGRIHFDLYPFQERTLVDMQHHRYNVILKSRQTGISTLTAGYSLWLMLFQNDKQILVIAIKQETAKNLITKVRYMNRNLPSWMKSNELENNKLSLTFNNGSTIKATTSTTEAGRSEALSLLIFDECQKYDTPITIRNKETGEISEIKIGKLFESDIY